MALSGTLTLNIDVKDKGISTLQRGLNGLENQAKGVGSMFKSVLGASLVSSGIQSAIGVVSSSFGSLLSDMQTTQTATNALKKVMDFKGISGDFIGLSKQMSTLAAQTNINTSDADSFASVLIGTGKSAKDTAAIVKAATIANQAFGGSGVAFKSVQMAMGQMTAAGKVTAENMNQITDANSALGAALKSQVIENLKKSGKNFTDFNDAVSKGAVSIDVLNNAMIDVQKKGGAAIQTLPDALSGLSETIGTKLQPAFDAITGTAAKSVNSITDTISKIDLTPIFNNLTSAGTSAFDKIKGLASKVDFGSIVNNAVNNFNSIIGIVQQFASNFVTNFQSAFKGTDMSDLFGSARNALGAFEGYAKSVFTGLSTLAQPLAGIFGTIAGAIGKATASLGSAYLDAYASA